MTYHDAPDILRERPVCFFSADRSFFFNVQHFALDNPSPCCFEDAMIIFYIQEGHGRIYINSIAFDLYPGCLCQLNSYHVFEIVPDEQGPLRFVMLMIDNTISNYLNISDQSNQAGEQSEAIFNQCPVAPLRDTQRAQVERIFSRFEAEDQLGDCAGSIVKMGLLGQLLNLFSSALPAEFTPPVGWRILTFITQFNSEKLTAHSVAERFQLSINALNRELRQMTTYNFTQLLARARINTVCALLLLKGFSLQFLANYIGFTSEDSFYRAFQRWKGMSPQEYRKTVLTQVYGYRVNSITDDALAIINYICQNYQNPISIKSAAQELYMNETQINRLLLQYTSTTFQTHLLHHRLRYAEALLRISPAPIGDIANEAGFNAVNTFCRVFKEHYGMTASAYRAAYGG